jgi:hypothetical protein
MDEGRKRVLAIVAGIIVARHLDTGRRFVWRAAGSLRTDKMVAAPLQWAERIIRKIDATFLRCCPGQVPAPVSGS